MFFQCLFLIYRAKKIWIRFLEMTILTQSNTIKLTDTEIEVYSIIKANPYITTTEIANITGKHRVTISKAISTLKENKIIERIGSNKKGYWKVLA